MKTLEGRIRVVAYRHTDCLQNHDKMETSNSSVADNGARF